MTTLIDRSPTHDCPACDGICPAEDLVVSPWTIVERGRRLYEQRVISLRCMHCNSVFSRTERRALDGLAWLGAC